MIIALEVLPVPSGAIHCLQENLRQLWHVPAWNKYDNQQFSCISLQTIDVEIWCQVAFLCWLKQNYLIYVKIQLWEEHEFFSKAGFLLSFHK